MLERLEHRLSETFSRALNSKQLVFVTMTDGGMLLLQFAPTLLKTLKRPQILFSLCLRQAVAQPGKRSRDV